GSRSVHGLGLGDVEQEDVLDAKALDDRLEEGAGLRVLVGDDDLGTGLGAGFGDAGGDGLLVRDAGDQTDLAFEADDGAHAVFLLGGSVCCCIATDWYWTPPG